MEYNHNNLPRGRQSSMMANCEGCSTLIPYDPRYAPICTDCEYQQQSSINAPLPATSTYLTSARYQTMQGMHPSHYQAMQDMQPSGYEWQGEGQAYYAMPEATTQMASFQQPGLPPRYSLFSNQPMSFSRSNMNDYPTHGMANGRSALVYEGMSMGSYSSDEEEDAFVDAQEEVAAYENGEMMAREIGAEISRRTNTDFENNFTTGASRDEEMEWEQVANGEDERDLFESAFPEPSSNESEDEGPADEADRKLPSTSLKPKSATKPNDMPPPAKPLKTAASSKTSQHPNTTTTSKAAPPASHLPNFGPPGPPDPVKSLSPVLKFYRDIHVRAKDLIPRLPLAPHRYWIGVLHIGVKSRTFNQEKHFTWMKGNRFTTVRTVWHYYQNTTATEDFVLLVGKERVEMGDRVEALDFFGDCKVFFRAVERGSAEAAGAKAMCAGLIPKAVEVAAGGSGGGKGGVCEVVEID
ncbi:hypothetical protein BDY17DRAFT_319925 [Neohortaea acidophila]|uniref:Uncharacterized protein n=1 Tax=Neohortaea acidophila TaxID=245834 RepID=A0A6A6Q4L5_9PEZI|nr:uncharacterized protein BDY17DRAFT_319925 [Neohortaea acidophila]KAF2487378.1 hypothetical protein BDY17DRAFT_319925 [Neohortaea acidophila]